MHKVPYKDYVLVKVFVALIHDTHMQIYGTNPNYWHSEPVRDSHMLLTSQDGLISVKRLRMRDLVNSEG